MNTTPVLVARRLSVGYPSRTILTGIDLFVGPGGSVALVGSNGSGKSTLLRTIVGLLPPVAGAIEVLGAPPGGQPRSIAYLSQFHASGFVLPLRAMPGRMNSWVSSSRSCIRSTTGHRPSR